jgi:hypothetical protein
MSELGGGAAPTRDADSRSLMRLGAACGLAAVAIAITQVVIEIVGWGIAGIPVPGSVEGWFGLLQSHRLLGLTELTGLQIPMFALLVPLFLAVHAALRPTNPALGLVAPAVGLVGIAVYLASNTAFSMLSLSDQWASATTDVERERLLAAGQAMLALYEGPGLDAGVFLVMVATLASSSLMLRSPTFGRATAAIGIVAGVIGFGYYAAIAFPSARIFVLEAAAPFFVLWIALTARGLLRVGSAPVESPAR